MNKPSNQYIPNSHWKTDQAVSVDTHTNVPDSRHHTTRFHRGHLHSALLEHVPQETIHLGKKIARAEARQDGVSLYFEDGSSAHGDVLIGADGIRSVSRPRVTDIFGADSALACQTVFHPGL